MRAILGVCVAACACASAPRAVPPAATVAVAQPARVAPRDVEPAAPRSTVMELPSESFRRLSASERERWYVCHPLFVHATRDGFTESARAVDYVKLRDGAARRAFLIGHGCPDTLVDAADGTHVDIVENPDPDRDGTALP